MSSTATKPMTARSTVLLPLRAGSGARVGVEWAGACALERAGVAAAAVEGLDVGREGGVAGLGGGVVGICLPTIVAAMSHSPPRLCAASLIPTTAPHFGQKAWSAFTEASHF